MTDYQFCYIIAIINLCASAVCGALIALTNAAWIPLIIMLAIGIMFLVQAAKAV